jgi:hypothetical protein
MHGPSSERRATRSSIGRVTTAELDPQRRFAPATFAASGRAQPRDHHRRGLRNPAFLGDRSVRQRNDEQPRQRREKQ